MPERSVCEKALYKYSSFPFLYLSLTTDAARCGRPRSSIPRSTTVVVVVEGDVNWTRTARPGTAAARLDDAGSSPPGHSRITALLTPCSSDRGTEDDDDDEETDAQRLVPWSTRSSVIEVTCSPTRRHYLTPCDTRRSVLNILSPVFQDLPEPNSACLVGDW